MALGRVQGKGVPLFRLELLVERVAEHVAVGSRLLVVELELGDKLLLSQSAGVGQLQVSAHCLLGWLKVAVSASEGVSVSVVLAGLVVAGRGVALSRALSRSALSPVSDGPASSR